MNLTDPRTLNGWLPPHSLEWYKQLSEVAGDYRYSWKSKLAEPNGESIFDHEVMQIIQGKKVLDVGCGHGQFTIKCGSFAKEIVGFDVTEAFIQNGLNKKMNNVSYVLGNTKNSLPFDENEFDCVYIRKGPTSAYLHLKRVTKDGGTILGLHPGDEMNKELPFLFPNLFESTIGTPILNQLHERLSNSHLSSYAIETINTTEYIESPNDVLKLRCFGQLPAIYEQLKEKDLQTITSIFNQHETAKGLPITFSRYIVRAIV